MPTNHQGPGDYVRSFKARGLDWCREAANEQRAAALRLEDPEQRAACGRIVDFLEEAIEGLEFERVGAMAAAQLLIDQAGGMAEAQSLIARVRRGRP